MKGKSMNGNVVDTFLAAIEAAALAKCEVFTPNATMDATVPNWRFQVDGSEAIREELARWYADPGRFQEIKRTPVSGGELVEFTLYWEE
jgi:hypothetical protein